MLSTSQRLLLLILIAPYALTDNSSPEPQGGTVGALLLDDAPKFSSGQVLASGWTTDESPGPEFGLPQASTPVIDSSELPLGGESIDCSGSDTGQIQPASKSKRSRIIGKREKTFCTNPQFQRPKPASEPSGRSQTKGPGSGEEAYRQPRLPEPDAEVIQNLVSRVKGTLGNANWALCRSSNPYYRVPICVPILPIRFSPAATVEPARLWTNWDECEDLFEDLWCCSIAKERDSVPESTLFSDPQFTTRYRATGLVCRLVRDPYGVNN